MRTGITRLLLHSVLIAAPAVLRAQAPAPAAPVAALGVRPHVAPRAWAPLAPAPDGDRRRPWLRNALVGAAVGGVVGYGLGRSSCDRCDEPAPIYAAAALGAGVGAVLGLAVTLTSRGAQVRWGAGVAAPVP